MSSYTVAIRNNETGEIRLSRWDQWDGENSVYQWTEGNYGCDCNRALFFYDQRPPADYPCGNEHFACLYAELEDGTRITLDHCASG